MASTDTGPRRPSTPPWRAATRVRLRREVSGLRAKNGPNGIQPASARRLPKLSEIGLGRDVTMELGAFSVSLAVKDIQASKEFYEKLGFRPFFGEATQGWLILKNGDHVIGLFQGMFEKNILTFNPGWNQSAQPLESFTDIRELQRELKAQGLQFLQEADESTNGPASFMVSDPDGNTILIDQHR